MSTYFHTSARTRMLITTIALTALAGCDGKPLDFDLRGAESGSTKEAALNATTERPKPDERGVITYPTYQVAVANKGDTLKDIANRVNISAEELAKYNGLPINLSLRKGEIIALPGKATAPKSKRTISTASAPPRVIAAPAVDVTTLAGNAIKKAPKTQAVIRTSAPRKAAPAPTSRSAEPIKHQVGRGETAFTVARLYQVPVKSLAEWNGLGSDFAVREGQYLLIPIARQAPPRQQGITAPGEGSRTPVPPSAVKPLPKDDTVAASNTGTGTIVADVGQQSAPAKATKMVFPVDGPIIREYAKGKNEGINISGGAGQSVKAAASGTVAAITKSSEGIPIIVIRHPSNLLTVYANVTDVKVKKGDAVGRSQGIAKLRTGTDAYLHFEVRNGFDSIDPLPYLR